MSCVLSPALDAVSTALSLTYDFNPLTSKITFRIGLSDDVESGLLPRFLHALRVNAPGVGIVVHQVDYWYIPDLFASGGVTITISQTRGLPANVRRKVLRTMQSRVLRAESLSDVLSLDEFCERPDVQVSPTGRVEGFVDDWLKDLGRSRKVVLSIPQFSSLPALLAGTNLLACPSDFAAQKCDVI